MTLEILSAPLLFCKHVKQIKCLIVNCVFVFFSSTFRVIQVEGTLFEDKDARFRQVSFLCAKNLINDVIKYHHAR